MSLMKCKAKTEQSLKRSELPKDHLKIEKYARHRILKYLLHEILQKTKVYHMPLKYANIQQNKGI